MEKCVGRLDRKSSRGMLYENEELRLKTININAEIERGELAALRHQVFEGSTELKDVLDSEHAYVISEIG